MAGASFEAAFLGRRNGTCCCYGWMRRGVSRRDVTVRAINEEGVGAWAVRPDLGNRSGFLGKTFPISSPGGFVSSLYKYAKSLALPLLTFSAFTFAASVPLLRA